MHISVAVDSGLQLHRVVISRMRTGRTIEEKLGKPTLMRDALCRKERRASKVETKWGGETAKRTEGRKRFG